MSTLTQGTSYRTPPDSAEGGTAVVAPITLTTTGRQRPRAQDPFKSHGRHFARTVDMFAIPAIVIQSAIERDHSKEMWEYTLQERHNYKAFDALCEIIPNLGAALEAAESLNGRSQQSIQAALMAGSNSARSEDTRTIKIALAGEWIKEDLKKASTFLSLSDKKERGFNNPVTGGFLCPAVLDYSDPRVREALANHTATIDGEPINGSDWPNFVYEHGHNTAAPWVGFLRGPLIVRAFRHIFTSPSSALDGGTGGTSNADRGTRTGNAALHGMTRVTPGSIVYAATHVHFALSSVSVFNKLNKDCDSVVFHESLVEYFDDASGRDAELINDLLEWWNRTVFPSQHNPGPRRNRGLERMHAARRRAQAAAPPPATSGSRSETGPSTVA